MRIEGRVFKFGDDVDTDLIIPARYLNTSDPRELAAHCMEDIAPDFCSKVHPGDIIVAGRNFGCGSSREHAPLAIKTAGVACVIAVSFARIFYRNAINIGLPILECMQAVAIGEGEELEVDFAAGRIRNLVTGAEYAVTPFPPFIRDLIAAGGLVNYVRSKMGA